MKKNDKTEYYYNRGMKYYELKQYAKAAADFEKAIKASPD